MNKKSQEQELEKLHEVSYAWALRCCSEKSEIAEEVLQNTYLKILEGKAKYKGKSTFKTWLFAVIRFTAMDYYRARKRKRTIPLETHHVEGIGINSESNIPSSLLFKQVLQQLSPKQQQVLHLVFYQNCSIQEAASIMEVQLGTARTHYERGKQKLRKSLSKYEASK